MRTWRWVIAMGVLGGCGTQTGTEKRDIAGGDVEAACLGTEVPLALDEVSPLGFSGQEVLEWLSEGARAPLTWSDDTTTTIDFDFAEGERGVYSAHYAQNPESDEVCDDPDAVLLGVAYTIGTADGRIDESDDAIVRSLTEHDAALVTVTEGEGGPLDDCVVPDGEQSLQADLTPGTTTGRLDCEGETTGELASW